MVPVINQIQYYMQFMHTPKIKAFINFIDGSQETYETNALSEVDALYYSSLNALVLNDVSLFNPVYTDFTRREPQEEAPFVRDDYLLFILVCCVIKFSTGGPWLEKVLNCRRCSLEECTQTINTFKNILKGDYQNSSNLTSIVTLIQYRLYKPLPTNAQLKSMYLLHTRQPFPFYKSEQLNLLTLKAIDIMITEADISGEGKSGILRSFETLFLKRTQSIAIVVYYALMVLLAFWVFKAYRNYNQSKDIIDVISAVAGVLGLLGWALPNFLNKDAITKFLQNQLRRALGYR